MVDLFAEWCAACKELDHYTFADAEVRQRLGDLVVARVDFTESNEMNEALAKRFHVVGLPAVIFLSPDGRELPNSRITGFVEADDFLAHLDNVLKVSNVSSKA